MRQCLLNLKILKLTNIQYIIVLNAISFIPKYYLKNPKSIFVLLIITLLSFGYFSKDFRLDASSDTLLIEGDPDLEYLKKLLKDMALKNF